MLKENEYAKCKLAVQEIITIDIQTQRLSGGPGRESFMEDIGFHLGPEDGEGLQPWRGQGRLPHKGPRLAQRQHSRKVQSVFGKYQLACGLVQRSLSGQPGLGLGLQAAILRK